MSNAAKNGVDVLVVLDRAVESAGLMVKESGDLRAVAYQDDLFKARAAVAELIDVASVFDGYVAEDNNDTSIMDREDLWERLSAALARVRGEA
jgi:hypothetical protein